MNLNKDENSNYNNQPNDNYNNQNDASFNNNYSNNSNNSNDNSANNQGYNNDPYNNSYYNQNFNDPNYNNQNYNNQNYNNSNYNNQDFNNSYNNNQNFNNYNNAPKKSNGYAIASLILGILSIPVSCCYGLGIVLAISGVILGVLSKRQNNGQIPGLGIAGIIISVLGVMTSIIMIIIYAMVITSPEFIDQLNEITNSTYNNSNF